MLPVAKPPTLTPPAMFSMIYVPQPEFAQPTMRKSHPDGAAILDYSKLLMLITSFPSVEATPNNLDKSTQCEKIWLVYLFLYAAYMLIYRHS
jgi:hypothetical protein